jgi:hypothetical protein
MYCLFVNVYCHRVSTQLQLTNISISITKAPSIQRCFQSGEQVKISSSQFRKVWGILQCCHIVLYWEILDQNRPVCWSIVVKEK